MNTATPAQPANIINHIGFLLDASGSMTPLRDAVVKVVDDIVAGLMSTSVDMDQETRITVWAFDRARASELRMPCMIWDKDVLRTPSVAGLYKPYGDTPLIDATLKAIDDLQTTSQLYGDHSFLLYVVTDGLENASANPPSRLKERLAAIPSNWTVAALVSGIVSRHHALRLGFPQGNIEVWDASSERGVEELGERIQRTNTSYMAARGQGVRTTTGLFDMSPATLNATTVAAAGLQHLEPDEYVLTVVLPKRSQKWDTRRIGGKVKGKDVEVIRIDEFTEENLGLRYVMGRGFYELTKAERIQPQKQIVVLNKQTQLTYTGKAARDLLGLPMAEVKVVPGQNPDFKIFVQSTSLNRFLHKGTQYLYLKK